MLVILWVLPVGIKAKPVSEYDYGTFSRPSMKAILWLVLGLLGIYLTHVLVVRIDE